MTYTETLEAKTQAIIDERLTADYERTTAWVDNTLQRHQDSMFRKMDEGSRQAQNVGEDRLRQVEAQMDTRLADQSSMMYSYLAEHYALRSQIPTTQPVANQQLSTPASLGHLGAKLNPPAPFTGKNPGACEPFFSQLALCFAANPQHYPTGNTKILFAISVACALAKT
ncbi:hypothetical protein DM01DRAFT_329144 [Hesseltinella vesiculosa]|uniref:Uncharacterized protein n=1 Tax=Hesseltinella vesiculosa TaxID=101127 RepID=A0A1X2GG60_9FUNG|nr:hypothetical protein DM01DRAFT_329144 [Hesseltinella vesiculosa]